MSSILSEPNKERREAVLHFCSLIEHSGLPDEFKEAMNQAVITKVEISTAQKKWCVHLLLQQLTPKMLIHQFAQEIAGQIEGLEELEFVVKYAAGNNP